MFTPTVSDVSVKLTLPHLVPLVRTLSSDNRVRTVGEWNASATHTLRSITQLTRH